jgi:hypothetical protein
MRLRDFSSSDVGFFSGSRITLYILIGMNSLLVFISVTLFLRSLLARRVLMPLRYNSFSAFLTVLLTALRAFRRALSFSFLAFNSFISRAYSTLRGFLGLRLRRFIFRIYCCSYKRSWIFLWSCSYSNARTRWIFVIYKVFIKRSFKELEYSLDMRFINSSIAVSHS